MAEGKRKHESRQLEEAPTKKLKTNASGTVSGDGTDPRTRLAQILDREIDVEINLLKDDLETIEDRIFQTKQYLIKVRQGVVSENYQQFNKTLLQRPFHPAVKKILRGKAPRIEEEGNTDSNWLSEECSLANSPLSDSGSKDMAEGNNSGEDTNNLLWCKSEPSPASGSQNNSDVLSGGSESQNVKVPRYIPPKVLDKSITKLCQFRESTMKRKIRLVIGNVSKWLAEQSQNITHKWTVYVKSLDPQVDLNAIISKAKFFLHPSYKPNDIIQVLRPPFKLTRRGWGEFPLRVQLHFLNNLNKPIDIIHPLKLDQKRTGMETFGLETVADLWLNVEAKLGEDGGLEGGVLKKEVTDCITSSRNGIQVDDKCKNGNVLEDCIIDKDCDLGLDFLKLEVDNENTEKCEPDSSGCVESSGVSFETTPSVGPEIKHSSPDSASSTNLCGSAEQSGVSDFKMCQADFNFLSDLFDRMKSEELLKAQVQTDVLGPYLDPTLLGSQKCEFSDDLLTFFESEDLLDNGVVAEEIEIPSDPVQKLDESAASSGTFEIEAPSSLNPDGSGHFENVSEDVEVSSTESLNQREEDPSELTRLESSHMVEMSCGLSAKTTNISEWGRLKGAELKSSLAVDNSHLGKQGPNTLTSCSKGIVKLKDVISTESPNKISGGSDSKLVTGRNEFRQTEVCIPLNDKIDSGISIVSPLGSANEVISEKPQVPRKLYLKLQNGQMREISGTRVVVVPAKSTQIRLDRVASPLSVSKIVQRDSTENRTLYTSCPKGPGFIVTTNKRSSLNSNSSPKLTTGNFPLVPKPAVAPTPEVSLANQGYILKNTPVVVRKGPALKPEWNLTKAADVPFCKTNISEIEITVQNDVEDVLLKSIVRTHVVKVPNSGHNVPTPTTKTIVLPATKSLLDKKTVVVQKKIVPGVSLLKKSILKPKKDNEDSFLKPDCNLSIVPTIDVKMCPNRDVESAVCWLVRHYPVVNERAKNPAFKARHPYCAKDMRSFLEWPLPKQRSAEWLRAKTIWRMLPNICPNFRHWTVVEILKWARLRGFTPVKYEEGISPIFKPDVTFKYTPCPDISELLEECKRKGEESFIDVVTVEEPKDVGVRSKTLKDVLSEGGSFIPLPSHHRELGRFIEEHCERIRCAFIGEEIVPSVFYPMSLRLMISIFFSLAEDLTRRSYEAAWHRYGDRAPPLVQETDVRVALLGREEFDLFTHEGEGAPLEAGVSKSVTNPTDSCSVVPDVEAKQ